MCKVCGTYFESRKGLSSHARLHLRQLGVAASENSGTPIELLYQLVQDSDGTFPTGKRDSPAVGLMGSSGIVTPQKVAGEESPAEIKEETALAPPSSSSAVRPVASRMNEGSSSSSDLHLTPTKPLWAPLETDAPITLASNTKEEVHVCELCGCWYETRKGLSSHARSHLRQIGIPDSEIRGSPVEFLYQMVAEEDPQPISQERQNPPSSSSKRPSGVSSPPGPPPSKKPKSLDCTCVLCGEVFEHRKGLSSHSRSHLRQLGVIDLLEKGSAIDTVQELVKSGVLEGVYPPKPNSAMNLSAVPSLALSLPPGKSQSPFSFPSRSPGPAKSPHSPPVALNRAPKAKKGFRLAVDPLLRTPKPEPLDDDDMVVLADSAGSGSHPAPKSLNADVASIPSVLCDFCGMLFDTRKALSCHVRAHLRQLGITWSVRTSPIDLLNEVMKRGYKASEPGLGEVLTSAKTSSSPLSSKRPVSVVPPGDTPSSPCTSPIDYSMKDKPASSKSAPLPLDTCCELCGFYFENRKALASHARAHLRQMGLFEWKVDGARSPIDLLSELIRKNPTKVAEVTRRYQMGTLYIKKGTRAAGSTSKSSGTDRTPGGTMKSLGQQPEHSGTGNKATITADSTEAPLNQPESCAQTKAGHSDHGMHSPRGHHPPKRATAAGREHRTGSSQQTPRSGNIPALLPKPPLTPLVTFVGKIYSLKCRFCEKVFQGPLSVKRSGSHTCRNTSWDSATKAKSRRLRLLLRRQRSSTP
ncbi:protein Wiz isoform X2 [Thalassophryne amazonica]|nr:protein Wiz isoform X2 [Thalassophryne amazonica]